MVMFDLPVVEKEERKAATAFRNYLLDEGFTMAQYSVYIRLLDSKEAAVAMEARMRRHLPPLGSVNVLTITDKQYENIHFYQKQKRKPPKNPDQLVLF